MFTFREFFIWAATAGQATVLGLWVIYLAQSGRGVFAQWARRDDEKR